MWSTSRSGAILAELSKRPSDYVMAKLNAIDGVIMVTID